MSEPVIKGVPFQMCPRCFNTGDHVPECLLDEVDPPPRETLYTRADLVRVAEASRQMVWVSLSYDKDPEIVFEETPEQVVDRLTKGET